MKKLLLFLGLSTMALGHAQNYPYGGYSNQDGYYNNGYNFYNDDFYQYASNNFPDDYFYNYPTDYYGNDYYQSMYNDYRNSISQVNWNVFFRSNGISQQQINLILSLNNRFSNYNAWNSYYGMNPNRWYYDRFYILERILGPRVFVILQNNYYNGYSPVVYYQNHWTNYYRPRYTCAPQYRSININIYRNDRNNFFQQHAPQYVNRNTNTSGFRNEHSSNNSGFSTASNQGNNNNGRRVSSETRNLGYQTSTRNNSSSNSPVRVNSAGRSNSASSSSQNSGFRSVNNSGTRSASGGNTSTRSGGGSSGSRFMGR